MRYRCPDCRAEYDYPTPPPSGVAYCPQCFVPMDERPASFTERVLRADVIPDYLKGIAAMMTHNGRV